MGRASREQLPFPSLGSPLCTLTDPDKRLFKSVQLSQKFFLQLLKMYLLEIGYSLLQLKPFWFWVGKSDCLLGFTRVTNSICSIPKWELFGFWQQYGIVDLQSVHDLQQSPDPLLQHCPAAQISEMFASIPPTEKQPPFASIEFYLVDFGPVLQFVKFVLNS